MKNDKNSNIHDWIWSVCMIALTIPSSLLLFFGLIASIAKILTS